MLYQSDSLNHRDMAVLIIISDLHLFQEFALLNPWFIFSKNLILSFIDKVRTGTYILALFVWHVVLLVCIAITSEKGGLTFGLPATQSHTII